MNNKTVLFTDLDGTIIVPASGKVFPEFIGDMEFKEGILPSLKNFVTKNNTRAICIVTNQAGIERGFVEEYGFNRKIEYIAESIRDYIRNKDLDIVFRYCKFANDTKNRKPGFGMLLDCLRMIERDSTIPKNEMLVIGNMSTDEQTANNFSIDYADVGVFIRQWYKL
jgi:HAD superfamily hydrolase (TIGR01662 family)